ncbi:Auxin-responsive protein saur72 [Ancistrocladus abbreviatus]
MKQLMRRLSKVADSSSTSYCLLRSDTLSATMAASRVGKSNRRRRSAGNNCSVPSGHLPVFVGDEMRRFVVSAELLNHPIFVKLLNKSAQEYGYEQKGVLHIPCNVVVFERVLDALRIGGDVSRDVHDLINSLSPSSDEFFL